MEIVIGFFISFAIAVTGVGAGTITAPVMILFLSVEPSVAIGTALVFSVLVKIPVGISYYFKKLVDIRVLLQMTTGGIPGVIAGSLLLGDLTKNSSLKSLVLVIVGSIILFSALINIIFMVKKLDITKHHHRLKFFLPMFTFFIGLEVGFSSAGAGAMGTLLLMYTTRLEPRQILGTDIMFGLILSAVGGGFHLSLGNVDYSLLARLAMGAALGVPAGIYGSTKISPKPFKAILLIWLVFIGSQLLLRGLGH
ncbi:MAG: sulfite exporter TauE/SafE family protein [Spirochaetia bacterium]|nr:sulfite exporter TauE/SafE family protein [Spirochaetia bacterium]